MEKKAFVVMPYDQKFNRVYSMLIKDAVERAGYECVRQDMAAQGGYILKNVIRNLAESDLVICLLSDFNWNVAYELGMRHTLARKGTILMCQKDQEKDMKFDLKGTNILFYDANWLDLEQDEQIINEILKMIQGIESRNESDSPVYDTYPELPNDLIQFVTSDQSEAVKKLQDENTALKKALEDAGLTKKEDTPHTDFRKTLMEAINNNVYYSDNAVAKLRELATEEDKTEFASFLADVIEKGYLDEVDCRIIYSICQSRIEIPPLTKAFLEKAVELHPDSEELNIFLANELAKNYNTQDQAFRLANEMFGITKKNGRYELTKHVSDQIIGAFYDVYLKLKKYTEITQLAEQLLEEYPKVSAQCRILQSTAIAYQYLDQLPQAKEFIHRAIALNPARDLAHYAYYRILRKEEAYPAAYAELEKCIKCEPSDNDYYYMMAGFICDEEIARTQEGDAPHTIEANDIRRYAVPFIVTSLARETSGSNLARAKDFLFRNGFQEDYDRCIQALQNGESILTAFENDLDLSMVSFCSKITSEQLRQFPEQTMQKSDRWLRNFRQAAASAETGTPQT